MKTTDRKRRVTTKMKPQKLPTKQRRRNKKMKKKMESPKVQNLTLRGKWRRVVLNIGGGGS